MKEILRLHARYNKNANKGMIECLKKLSPGEFNKDVELYYKSIAGAFEHALALDALVFGNVYAKYSIKPLDNKSIVSIAGPNMTINEPIKSDMDKLFQARIKVDDFIVELIENIDDFSKVEVLEFPGIKFEKPIYQLLISILTHDTHHRGQIAGALDRMKIENDFNGMLGV
ncbi:DinB family protein [Helicobacter sp. 11S03491-1]|uniref:DinB family protein n=1 Tax=Helicobacter sp. 11S03491-1 TaxID=1476196 RepID=UPI000BA7BD4B|nr:DinB family protein [Helicobacter sp. 11S03491-1]PAF41559.1 hypothetical protein BKH45_06555 [Helicobacter sp. 11S03491-1]